MGAIAALCRSCCNATLVADLNARSDLRGGKEAEGGDREGEEPRTSSRPSDIKFAMCRHAELRTRKRADKGADGA